VRLFDPGPKALWHHHHNGRGLMSATVEFESSDVELFKSMVTMLETNEKFYALTGAWKIPVVASDIFRPTPAFLRDDPKARFTLHSVGAPEPYMQFGPHARPAFVPSTLPRIPKLWDVPLDYRALNYHLCDPPYGRSPLSRAYVTLKECDDYRNTFDSVKDIGFTAAAMEQARGRLVRSMREKIDAMMMGTLETKHKEKKVMFDKKVIKANRFYVGSERALRTGWGKPTLAEAVEHAKKLQAETGEDQFVVQIVRVVKKKEQPVIVEAVK
jgi:hypothetical protein